MLSVLRLFSNLWWLSSLWATYVETITHTFFVFLDFRHSACDGVKT